MARGGDRRYREAMSALDILNRGAWCVVSDMTSRVLSWIELGAMPEWRVRFGQIIQAAIVADWILEEEHPLFSSFFCRRGGQRICVRLQPSPPRNPMSQALPAPSPSIQDCLELPELRGI